MILSLDPSSTVIGYAWMDVGDVIAQAGLLTPAKPRASAVERIDSLLMELRAMMAEMLCTRAYSVSAILVELPTGKQHTRAAGRRSGLPVWACAAGAVYGMLSMVRYCRLVPVGNTDWTGGGPDKAARQILCRALYPAYDPARDPGGDVSDAVMMARWWLEKERP